MRGIESGTPLYATATGTSSAVATLTAVAGKSIYGSVVTGSSDLTGATLQIKDGSTVIWQDRISNTAAYYIQWDLPIASSVGNTLSVTVTGTSASNANISGYVA